MKKFVITLIFSLFCSLSLAESVLIRTSMGDIIAKMEPKSPITVKNFLSYVDSGHYNGLIFHRVIDNFMIQGGGFDENFQEQPTKAPINNESNNYVRNERATLAMARTADPNSATAQFYINLKKNGSLDYRFGKPGYAVFGHVTQGFDVVKAIGKVETTSRVYHQNVPVEPVIILEIKRLPAGEPAQ